jgi:hypothetical protein
MFSRNLINPQHSNVGREPINETSLVSDEEKIFRLDKRNDRRYGEQDSRRRAVDKQKNNGGFFGGGEGGFLSKDTEDLKKEEKEREILEVIETPEGTLTFFKDDASGEEGGGTFSVSGKEVFTSASQEEGLVSSGEVGTEEEQAEASTVTMEDVKQEMTQESDPALRDFYDEMLHSFKSSSRAVQVGRKPEEVMRLIKGARAARQEVLGGKDMDAALIEWSSLSVLPSKTVKKALKEALSQPAPQIDLEISQGEDREMKGEVIEGTAAFEGETRGTQESQEDASSLLSQEGAEATSSGVDVLEAQPANMSEAQPSVEIEISQEEGEVSGVKGEPQEKLKDENPNEEPVIEGEPLKEGVFLEKVASKEAEESKPTLEEYKQRVEEARQLYVETDREKTTAWDKLRRFFGKDLKKDEDGDVLATQARYKEALLAYKEACLADVKLQGLEGDILRKALADTLYEMNFEERLALYDARTKAGLSLKNPEAGALQWAQEKLVRAIDWYRKLSFVQKMMVSGGIMAVGAAGAWTGGMAVGSAIWYLRKGFGSAVVGRGAFQALEAHARNKEKLEMEFKRESESLHKDLTRAMSSEEMISLVEHHLGEGIEVLNEKLNNLMKQRTRRAVVAGLSGVTLAVVPQVLWEKFGWHDGGVLVGGEMELEEGVTQTGGSSAPFMEGANQPGPETGVGEVTEESVEEVAERSAERATEKTSELVVAEGSGQSIEGQLTKYLADQGYDRTEAGAQAHNMVRNYIQEHGGSLRELNHIVSAKITLDSENPLKIASLETQPLERVAHHAQQVHSKLGESLVEKRVSSSFVSPEGSGVVREGVAEAMVPENPTFPAGGSNVSAEVSNSTPTTTHEVFGSDRLDSSGAENPSEGSASETASGEESAEVAEKERESTVSEVLDRVTFRENLGKVLDVLSKDMDGSVSADNLNSLTESWTRYSFAQILSGERDIGEWYTERCVRFLAAAKEVLGEEVAHPNNPASKDIALVLAKITKADKFGDLEEALKRHMDKM